MLEAARTTSASGATGHARSSVMSNTVAPERCTPRRECSGASLITVVVEQHNHVACVSAPS